MRDTLKNFILHVSNEKYAKKQRENWKLNLLLILHDKIFCSYILFLYASVMDCLHANIHKIDSKKFKFLTFFLKSYDY